MTKAIYPGTFDPITDGHMDIIKSAAKTFDTLYVAVMVNNNKKCTFTVEERVELIKECTKEFNNIKVVSSDGFTVDFAQKLGCSTIIRGIRAVTDYEYELAQATINMKLNPNVETYFMVSKPDYSFLSSTMVKDIAFYGGSLRGYVPKEILKKVESKLKAKR